MSDVEPPLEADYDPESRPRRPFRLGNRRLLTEREARRLCEWIESILSEREGNE